MTERIHVLPVNDIKPHVESEACECDPRVEQVEGGTVIVHRSYDQRELWEQSPKAQVVLGPVFGDLVEDNERVGGE